MNTDSYWLKSTSLPRFKKLEESREVDVVVVGAGITGITAAYLLKRAGKRVALLERDRCVSEDTAATTAHLTCVMDARLSKLVKIFGKDHARAAWDAGLAGIDLIESIVRETESSCEFRRVPGYLHGSLHKKLDEEREELRKETELAVDLGFDATYVEHTPIFRRAAMRIANQAKFHPVAYLRTLLQTIDGGGSFICESSEVEEFSDKPLAVKANGHRVKCNHIVIATHVPLMGNNGLVSATFFQSKLSQYSSYAIGTRVEGKELPEADFWDTSDPYYYTRVDTHRGFQYVIFGGEDHKTGQVEDTAGIYKKLEHRLHLYVPLAKVDHRWSGQVVETNDGLPLMGELGPKQFVATGFSGNGMTFGTVGAQMACDWVMGRKNPWADLFDVHRKKVLGGTWDYIKENLDYPYYLMKDRFMRADRSDLKSLERGEGKILLHEGKRVAVSRNEKGKLFMVSAICTHLGCVVHWNAAEKTWDCPCHGSRFKCTGEVMTGPAETPLEEVKKNGEEAKPK